MHEPQAAQIHIYHTMRGLQRAGHKVSLLALQGRQVLFTPDLQVFKSDERTAGHQPHSHGSKPHRVAPPSLDDGGETRAAVQVED